MDRDRILDVMLRNEMAKLNTHLPQNRKTIRELLAEESPSVLTVDGKKVVMKKTEIEAFAKNLVDSLWDQVRLPIVFVRHRELGSGAFKVLGDSREEYALSKILGIFEGSLNDFQRLKGSEVVFYRPQVSEFIRRFHSITVVGFGLSE